MAASCDPCFSSNAGQFASDTGLDVLVIMDCLEICAGTIGSLHYTAPWNCTTTRGGYLDTIIAGAHNSCVESFFFLA